jgi:hypothetical protein
MVAPARGLDLAVQLVAAQLEGTWLSLFDPMALGRSLSQLGLSCEPGLPGAMALVTEAQHLSQSPSLLTPNHWSATALEKQVHPTRAVACQNASPGSLALANPALSSAALRCCSLPKSGNAIEPKAQVEAQRWAGLASHTTAAPLC